MAERDAIGHWLDVAGRAPLLTGAEVRKHSPSGKCLMPGY